MGPKRTLALLTAALTALAVLSCAPAIETTTEAPVTSVLSGDELVASEAVRWIGRTRYDETDAAMYFYHAATGFTVAFEGTSLSIRLTASNADDPSRRPWFTVSVDDEIAPEGTSIAATADDGILVLADGLAYGTHTLTFLKRSEPIDSVTAIVSIETDGALLPAPAAPALRMLVLGGSGASGYGNLGSPAVSRTTANSDSLQSFGFLAARELGADVQFVSAAGWGLKWGFNPTNRNGTVNIRAAFETVGIDDEEELVDVAFDVSSYVPDYVVVNLGGNDFDAYVLRQSGTALIAAKAAFRDAVTDLVTRLHGLYPDAWIVWTHTGSQNGAEAETAIGDLDPKHAYTRILIIPKVGEYGDPVGSNGHYSVASHRRAADLIVDLIATLP